MTDENIVYTIAIWLIPLVFAIVFHEVAHGWVARAFGDPTAAGLGRLTLNPIKHVDPVGTVILPMVLAIANAPIFGWAKPVPVVAARLRNPRVHMMLVALAGPASNFALAIVTAGLLAAALATSGLPQGDVQRFVYDNLWNFLLINVFLGTFNLIPLPPFDGGHIVEGLLPRSALPAWHRIAQLGFPLLIVLLLVLPALLPEANIVARVIGPIARGITEAIIGLFGLSFGRR